MRATRDRLVQALDKGRCVGTLDQERLVEGEDCTRFLVLYFSVSEGTGSGPLVECGC